MVSMGWTRPTVDESQYVGLRLTTANGFAIHPPLVAWVKDANGFETQASIAGLGMANNPNLSTDSTLVPWLTRRWPSTLPADQPMRVRVATSDGTASTGWLAVYSNAVRQRPSMGPGG